MTRSSLTGCGLAVAAILLMADGAWGQSGSAPSTAPTWGKPATTVPPAAGAKPIGAPASGLHPASMGAGAGWGSGGSSHASSFPVPPQQSVVVRPAPAALGWAKVKPGQPVNSRPSGIHPPGTHVSGTQPPSTQPASSPSSGSQPASPPPAPAPAREVSCQMTHLHPGWKWTVTNHTAQTFTQHQLFTFKTHYPWANSNIPASAFDSEGRINLTLPLAPGASAVLLTINTDLDPMTAPPTCEVETIGDYVVQ